MRGARQIFAALTGLSLLFASGAGVAAEQLRVVNGSERFIDGSDSIERITVGDDNVVDVQVLDSTTQRLLGLKPGHTTLSVWRGESSPALYEVIVSAPVSAIQARLNEDPRLRPAKLVGDGDKILLYGDFGVRARETRPSHWQNTCPGPRPST